ncbi:MAG: hypothetical protein MJ237_02710 [bacterium]|nr:hypothetical protein [bacterium]
MDNLPQSIDFKSLGSNSQKILSVFDSNGDEQLAKNELKNALLFFAKEEKKICGDKANGHIDDTEFEMMVRNSKFANIKLPDGGHVLSGTLSGAFKDLTSAIYSNKLINDYKSGKISDVEILIKVYHDKVPGSERLMSELGIREFSSVENHFFLYRKIFIRWRSTENFSRPVGIVIILRVGIIFLIILKM